MNIWTNSKTAQPPHAIPLCPRLPNVGEICRSSRIVQNSDKTGWHTFFRHFLKPAEAVEQKSDAGPGGEQQGLLCASGGLFASAGFAPMAKVTEIVRHIEAIRTTGWSNFNAYQSAGARLRHHHAMFLPSIEITINAITIL